MEKIVIDLGKGVKLIAPIKHRVTADEWKRMSNYINGLLRESALRVK